MTKDINVIKYIQEKFKYKIKKSLYSNSSSLRNEL